MSSSVVVDHSMRCQGYLMVGTMFFRCFATGIYRLHGQTLCRVCVAPRAKAEGIRISTLQIPGTQQEWVR